ncbi:MAG: hypothetical protein ACP5MD_13340, partial [Verrucomicrobiia bacterium]
SPTTRAIWTSPSTIQGLKVQAGARAGGRCPPGNFGSGCAVLRNVLARSGETSEAIMVKVRSL